MSTKAPVRRKRATKRAPAARKAIDPRIRDRRIEVLRKQGRRRLRWMLGLIALGLMLVAGWFVIHSPLLDVERVRVTGTQQATPVEIRRAAGVNRGEAILFVDTGAVERDVERVPWVDKARVERSLGGELAIHVTERRPAAWVRRAPDRVAVVDVRGRVLADAAAPPGELPEITGLRTVPSPGREVVPAAVPRVLGQLPPELGLRAARIGLDGDAVTLAVRDGPEVRFGLPQRVAAKARAALAVLETTAGGPPRYIDVRVPSEPVAG